MFKVSINYRRPYLQTKTKLTSMLLKEVINRYQHSEQSFYFIFLDLFILCAWVFCLHVCLCSMFTSDVHWGEKRALNLLKWLIDVCEPLCGYWELYLGLCNNKVFLTVEPSLQIHKQSPHNRIKKNKYMLCWVLWHMSLVCTGEAESLWSWGHPGLHSKFQTS